MGQSKTSPSESLTVPNVPNDTWKSVSETARNVWQHSSTVERSTGTETWGVDRIRKLILTVPQAGLWQTFGLSQVLNASVLRAGLIRKSNRQLVRWIPACAGETRLHRQQFHRSPDALWPVFAG